MRLRRKLRRAGSSGEALWRTATIATFFVERDAESDESEVASAAAIAQLTTEITALRSKVAALLTQKDH